jgi:hypothetical protein
LQLNEAGERTDAEAFFAVMAPGPDAPAVGTVVTAREWIVEICLTGSLRVRVSLAAGSDAFVQTLRAVLQVLAS